MSSMMSVDASPLLPLDLPKLIALVMLESNFRRPQPFILLDSLKCYCLVVRHMSVRRVSTSSALSNLLFV